MIVKAQPSVQDRTGQPMFRSPNIKISAAKLAPHHIYTPQFHISGPEAIAMAEIANFVILHGGPGQCSLTHIYEPNEAAYTYVASAIAIAMKAFENEKLQYWLTKLAMEFDQNKRGGQSIFDGDQARARETVVLFLHKVRNNFPKVVIDETITDPACLGTHTRAPLEESQEQFNPRECWISLNAQVTKTKMPIFDTLNNIHPIYRESKIWYQPVSQAVDHSGLFSLSSLLFSSMRSAHTC
ncbi:hypothetical protein IWX91DRAFT_390176 [Phyllosticta citricarpa]